MEGHMLTSAEEAELRASLRFRTQDRWLQLLYRRVSMLHLAGGVCSSGCVACGYLAC